MKLEALKLEIRKIVQERSINAIAKLQQKNIENISKALEFYKKNKHTDKKEAFIKVLKKLGVEKANLAGELDLKVSGMYKDAEYKGESVVKESINEGFDSNTGLYYLDTVPFTAERIKEVVLFMKNTKVKSKSNQFEYTPQLLVKDKGPNKGEVVIDLRKLKELIQGLIKHQGKGLASDKDFSK